MPSRFIRKYPSLLNRTIVTSECQSVTKYFILDPVSKVQSSSAQPYSLNTLTIEYIKEEMKKRGKRKEEYPWMRIKDFLYFCCYQSHSKDKDHIQSEKIAGKE